MQNAKNYKLELKGQPLNWLSCETKLCHKYESEMHLVKNCMIKKQKQQVTYKKKILQNVHVNEQIKHENEQQNKNLVDSIAKILEK